MSHDVISLFIFGKATWASMIVSCTNCTLCAQCIKCKYVCSMPCKLCDVNNVFKAQYPIKLYSPYKMWS